jgi:hypothetical protein
LDLTCRQAWLRRRLFGGMTTIADAPDEPRVIGGVDTHKDVHLAAVLDELGRLLDTASVPATPSG